MDPVVDANGCNSGTITYTVSPATLTVGMSGSKLLVTGFDVSTVRTIPFTVTATHS